MESGGWVKLHRKLLKNPISKRPQYLSVWVHILLKANHETTHFIWNNKKQEILAGQCMIGLNSFSKETGVPKTTIHRILKYLENETQIGTQKTNKFTIVTVINWRGYQKNGTQSGTQMELKRKHTRMYKNDKKIKEREIDKEKEKENKKDYEEGLRNLLASKRLVMKGQDE